MRSDPNREHERRRGAACMGTSLERRAGWGERDGVALLYAMRGDDKTSGK
jgi:hypothetical protein